MCYVPCKKRHSNLLQYIYIYIYPSHIVSLCLQLWVWMVERSELSHAELRLTVPWQTGGYDGNSAIIYANPKN